MNVKETRNNTLDLQPLLSPSDIDTTTPLRHHQAVFLRHQNMHGVNDHVDNHIFKNQATAFQTRKQHGNESYMQSVLDDRDDNNVDLDMDAITQLEHASYSAGYDEGAKRGQHFGRIEGRTLGREKGFELWEEIGYYRGTVRIWTRVIQEESQSGRPLSRKALKQLQHLHNLEALINDMPRRNDSSTLEEDTEMGQSGDVPDLQKLLERIRARYKLVRTSLGTPSLYALRTSHEAADAPTQSVDSLGQGLNTKQQMAQVAGQTVDVNQLRY